MYSLTNPLPVTIYFYEEIINLFYNDSSFSKDFFFFSIILCLDQLNGRQVLI